MRGVSHLVSTTHHLTAHGAYELSNKLLLHLVRRWHVVIEKWECVRAALVALFFPVREECALKKY